MNQRSSDDSTSGQQPHTLQVRDEAVMANASRTYALEDRLQLVHHQRSSLLHEAATIATTATAAATAAAQANKLACDTLWAATITCSLRQQQVAIAAPVEVSSCCSHSAGGCFCNCCISSKSASISCAVVPPDSSRDANSASPLPVGVDEAEVLSVETVKESWAMKTQARL